MGLLFSNIVTLPLRTCRRLGGMRGSALLGDLFIQAKSFSNTSNFFDRKPCDFDNKIGGRAFD